ncbi:hypothetical protein ACP70R_027255 [Stipagrostis hirtigluma subsp. patula]
MDKVASASVSSAAGERGRPAGRSKAKGRRSSSAPPEKMAADLTPRERRAAAVRLFMRVAIADAEAYVAMAEDEVEEEYRRAGKLHRYDPDKEWQKRLARVARKYPPPEGLITHPRHRGQAPRRRQRGGLDQIGRISRE